jgi:hypothetical protein
MSRCPLHQHHGIPLKGRGIYYGSKVIREGGTLSPGYRSWRTQVARDNTTERALTATQVKPLSLWHQRFGHLNLKTLLKMASIRSATGLALFNDQTHSATHCRGCLLGMESANGQIGPLLNRLGAKCTRRMYPLSFWASLFNAPSTGKTAPSPVLTTPPHISSGMGENRMFPTSKCLDALPSCTYL